MKFNFEDINSNILTKDDIDFLKSHPTEELKKEGYKVIYFDEMYMNNNDPSDGYFELWQRVGRYGYDTYAFYNEKELCDYIKRHFAKY